MAAPAGSVTVAGTAGNWAETKAEVILTTASLAGVERVDGGTITWTCVGGRITLAVADGRVTVALMGWPLSPTPETVTVWLGTLATVLTSGVTALGVTAPWRRGGT